jgi:hypothetical protein
MSNADKIAALEREIAALKATTPAPTIDTTQAAAQWRDEMHQLRERRANSFQFSPSVLREMVAACDTATIQDLARHGTVQSASQAGASGQISSVHGSSGLPGTQNGWRNAAPISPPPGIRWVDAQLDAQDAKDKAARIAEEAQVRAVRGAMEPKP